MPNWKKVITSGSDGILNSLNLTSTGSGQTVLDIQGSQGQLFSITDDLTGDIFSISDISGAPIFNINASGATTFDGYVPDNSKLKFGNSEDLEIYHDGTHSWISDQGTGNLTVLASAFVVNNAADSENMIIASSDGSVNLYYNGAQKFRTISSGVEVTGGWVTNGVSVAQANVEHTDNTKSLFGNGNDLQIYHDGSNSYIDETGTGGLYLKSSAIRLQSAGGENMIYGVADSAVYIYHNNAKKFETTATGITVTGGAAFSGDVQLLTSTGEYSLYGQANAQTALYHNGVKKFETNSGGITVTGNTTFSGFVLDGNTITGIDDSGEFTNNDSHIMTSAAVEDKILGYNYNNYSLPLGTSSARGGFKIGYAESGKNYPVELSAEKMYVNVPWTDTNTNTQRSDEEITKVISDAGFITTDTNTFRNVTAGGNTLGSSESLDFVAGSNVSISETGGNITISSTDTNTDTNTQLSTAEVRGKFSGTGINTSTGVITNTNTQLSTADVRGKISGTGLISYNNSTGVISTTANNITNTNQLTNGAGFITSFTNTVDMGDGFKIANSGGTDQFTVTENEEIRFAGSGATSVSFDSSTQKVTISSTDTNTDTNTQLSTADVRGKISGTGLISYNNSTGVISTTANNITNNNQLTNGAGYRTSAQVDAAIATVVDSAPAALNTLNELAASLGDDSDFAGSVTTSLAGKLSTSGKAADSNLLDGLDLHTARNNEANKVVRTDSNGYANFGWINTTSGATSGTINRIYCSADSYIRYMTPANFRTSLISGGSNVSISSAGVISSTDTNTQRSDEEITKVISDAGFVTTDTNTQLSTAQVRSKISASGNSSYNSSTGVITSTDTNTQLSDAQVRSKFTGGTNVSISSGGVISSTDTNTTYSVGAGGLTQQNFTTTLKNKLDALDSSTYLKSNADDSFSGGLVSTARDEGIFGTYDSYKTDHIWSMGTSYKNHASGTNFGSLYGLAYKHTNNSTGGTMAGGHQMVWCTNGNPKAALGESGIWTSGTVSATGGSSTNWNTAYGWGNHASAGYKTTDNNTQLSTADVRSKISASGNSQYNASTGVITSTNTNTQLSTADVRAKFSAGTNVAISSGGVISSTDTNTNTQLSDEDVTKIVTDAGFITTDTNTQLSDAQVRSKISGTGLISYNNSTGVISTTANNYSFPYTVSAGASNSTVVQRNGNGYIFASYFNGTGTFSTSGAGSGMGLFTGTNGSDNYGRSFTAAAARALLNVADGATNVTNNSQISNGRGYITSYTDTNTQRAAGSGLTLSGNTLSHTDTSSQGSVNGSGRTYIQDITLDTYGHVTGLATATETVVNTDTNTQLSDAQVRSKFSAGSNVSISSGGVISSTDTNTNTQLSDSDVLKIVGDGGYITTDTNTTYSAGSGLSLSGTTFSHTDTSSQGSSNNSGRTYIQDITLDTYGHVTGLSTATETVENTDTNTTYSADGNYGLTLSGTTFRLEDDRRRNSTAVDIYTGNTHDYVFFDASHGMRFYTAGAEDMRLDNSGNLHVDNDVVAASTTISDERLKDNVTTIENPLDKIKALRGVEYDWNAGSRKGKHDLGLIAQEVEKVIPTIVHEHEQPFLNDDEDDNTLYKTIDYEKMVAVLIEGMKEQQTQIDSLKSELTEIKGKL